MSTFLSVIRFFSNNKILLAEWREVFEEHHDDRANLQKKKNVQKNINYGAKKVKKKEKERGMDMQ